jgi:hypothetical protein
MSEEMFCEVRNVTTESDSGKKRSVTRRRITREKITLDDHLSLSPQRERPKKTTSKEDHFKGILIRGAV